MCWYPPQASGGQHVVPVKCGCIFPYRAALGIGQGTARPPLETYPDEASTNTPRCTFFPPRNIAAKRCRHGPDGGAALLANVRHARLAEHLTSHVVTIDSCCVQPAAEKATFTLCLALSAVSLPRFWCLARTVPRSSHSMPSRLEVSQINLRLGFAKLTCQHSKSFHFFLIGVSGLRLRTKATNIECAMS